MAFRKWFLLSMVSGMFGSMLGAFISAIWGEMGLAKWFVTSEAVYVFVLIMGALIVYVLIMGALIVYVREETD